MEETKPRFYQKQPWNGLIAIALFFAPIVGIHILLGELAAMGAAIYLALMFLVGTVEIKWVPWKEKFKLCPATNTWWFKAEKKEGAK